MNIKPKAKANHYILEDGSDFINHLYAILGYDGFISFCKGNILKYTARLGKKDSMIDDLKKNSKLCRIYN